MIPKVIHYCWFGDKPLNTMAEKCIASWRKYCPDFEIKEWNERNFDISKNPYCVKAYKSKKWAFVSDYVRLAVLAEHGGFYQDTDSELIRPIGDLCDKEFICGTEENNDTISGIIAGFFGVSPKNRAMIEILSMMESNEYSENTVLMHVLNQYFLERGYDPNLKEVQVINGIHIYPPDYFSAKDNALGEYRVTKNTYAVHHYSSSWKHNRRIRELIKKILGVRGMRLLRKIYRRKSTLEIVRGK